MSASANRGAELGKTSFICPHCQAFAQQDTAYLARRPITRYELTASAEAWSSGDGQLESLGDALDGYWRAANRPTERLPDYFVTTCAACERPSFWRDSVLWHETVLVWPVGRGGALPELQMPEDVLELYNEARDVVSRSPRAAATLLRVALERLVNGLAPGSGNLNSKIGDLVKQGLSTTVQQAMDAMRVFGNDGAHAGQLDPSDTLDRAVQLFDVINMIVRQVIVEPAAIAALYNTIPPGKRDQVTRRDGTQNEG